MKTLPEERLFSLVHCERTHRYVIRQGRAGRLWEVRAGHWLTANKKTETNTVGFHLYKVRGSIKFIETESILVAAKDWRGGENGELFNGDRVSVWEDESVSGMDSGDGCTTMGMCLIPLNRPLKNG